MKKTSIIILLVVAVTLESLCQITGILHWEKTTNSLVYFISGMLIACLPLIKTTSTSVNTKNQIWINRLFYFVFLLLTIYLVKEAIPWGRDIFNYHQLNYKKADMLPIIQRMCRRFATGEPVYETLPFWDGTEPIYLPAMWLPFFPFEYFQLDIRWANMLFILIGLSCIYCISRKGNFSWTFLLIGIPLYFLFDYLMKRDYRLFYLTEEPVVIAYYLFLAFALAKNRPYLIGIALSCCLMSRFALVFWAIMYFGYLFFFKNRLDALKIGSVCTVFSLFLLLTTGAFWQLAVILNLPNIYIEHLLDNEWKFNSFTNNHLGLLKFFPFSQIELVHQLFFISSIIIPTLCFTFYWKYREAIHQPFFAICSLKLSLVFFYNLLIMPFLYLFYTSTFLSIAIFSWYLKESQK